MTLNTIFIISSYLAIPFWFLMIFLPNWKWTQRIIGSPYIIVPAAAVYAAVTLPGYFNSYGSFDLFDLAKTAEFFGQEGTTLGNWLHFVAVDLFVGRWIYLDARERGIPVILTSVILFGVLNSTPTGALIYFAVRIAHARFFMDAEKAKVNEV